MNDKRNYLKKKKKNESDGDFQGEKETFYELIQN